MTDNDLSEAALAREGTEMLFPHPQAEGTTRYSTRKLTSGITVRLGVVPVRASVRQVN